MLLRFTFVDMIQTIKAEYTTKLDAHKAEKEELAEQLNLQLNLTESLAKEAEDLRTQMESNKRLTLQTIKETLKDNCECSICLGICTKVCKSSLFIFLTIDIEFLISRFLKTIFGKGSSLIKLFNY